MFLKQAPEKEGLTQEQVTQQMNTKKTTVTRIENHAEDIHLSTLEKYANTVGIEI